MPIKLDDEEVIRDALFANEVRETEITIGALAIDVTLQWVHVLSPFPGPPTETVTKTEHIRIEGADFQELRDLIIGPAQVGKSMISLFRKAVRNKVKDLKALQGTVE